MITLTSQAKEQIRNVAARCDAEGMFLRITARLSRGGRIIHGMGFDERRGSDQIIDADGIPVVVNSWQKPLLEGAVLDYVRLNTGDYQFIYNNPNDTSCANYLGVCGGCEEECMEAGGRMTADDRAAAFFEA